MSKFDELITQLRKRVWQETSQQEVEPAQSVYQGKLPRPPLTEEQIAQAEQHLGFCLPVLVRRLYLEVGDGH